MNDNITICEQCGHDIQHGEWAFCPHGWAGKSAQALKSNVFPFVTPHIRGDGQPMTITDIAHLRKVEKEYGVVLPAFAQNEHDLDPIKNPPVYRGYDYHGDTAYRSADPDRQAWARKHRDR